jgi:hypothetical protein
MGFSYGKLSQSHQLDDHEKQLKAIIRKGRITSFVIWIGLVAIVIILLSMFLGKDTEMLTKPRSFVGSNTFAFFLFCVAVVVGCWVGFRYPTRWWKRLFSAPFFVLIIFSLFMLAVGQYNRFQEYRLFNNGQSAIDYEQFTVVGVDRSGKNRLRDRRPVGVYVIVENEKYRKQGHLDTDHQTYDFLLANGGELTKMYVRAVYVTGYCVKLRVEHNGNAARILVDGKITLDQLIKCPPPSSAMIGTAGTGT